MIDGKLLDALVAVVRLRNFEKAARHLGITQSAVSQRIQALEESVGQPLVIRSQDGQPTAAGEHILRFAQQVEALERDAMTGIGHPRMGKWSRVAVAVNADSLATWFKGTLDLLMHRHSAAVELVLCDQSETIVQLRAGTVLACVSSWPEPIQGCSCQPLGKMLYRCVASREALEKTGIHELNRKLAAALPAVIFGRHDDIVADFVKRAIGLEAHDYPCHIVPSTADLLSFVLSGYGYSLLPSLQIDPYIRRRTLVDIHPQRTHEIPLYWHRWKISTNLIDKLSEYVSTAASRRLEDSNKR